MPDPVIFKVPTAKSQTRHKMHHGQHTEAAREVKLEFDRLLKGIEDAKNEVRQADDGQPDQIALSAKLVREVLQSFIRAAAASEVMDEEHLAALKRRYRNQLLGRITEPWARLHLARDSNRAFDAQWNKAYADIYALLDLPLERLRSQINDANFHHDMEHLIIKAEFTGRASPEAVAFARMMEEKRVDNDHEIRLIKTEGKVARTKQEAAELSRRIDQILALGPRLQRTVTLLERHPDRVSADLRNRMQAAIKGFKDVVGAEDAATQAYIAGPLWKTFMRVVDETETLAQQINEG